MAKFDLFQWTSGRDLDGYGELEVAAISATEVAIEFHENDRHWQEAERLKASLVLTLDEVKTLIPRLHEAFARGVAEQEARLAELKK